jgi:4-alpha-glucanotransferase
MKIERSNGVLLHPTSLPGPYGIGDLGPEAYRWLDFLASAGVTLWQILPLGPTGYGDSPYQCFSAFAGNPYLISPDFLLQDSLLTQADLSDMPEWGAARVDFGGIYRWKPALLDRAFSRYEQIASQELRDEFVVFCATNAAWLDDFALFMALKEANAGHAWVEWEESLRKREPAALSKARRTHAAAITRQAFRQFLFFRQWLALKRYANDRGIKIIGDVPIFVAFDSSDAWSHPDLFFLDEHGHLLVQAGVPPDYFSPTGQLWGNPLYRWDVHKGRRYSWWIERFRATLAQMDIVRLDHFRGFAGYWEVPGEAETAERGRWVPGPGADFLRALKNALGDLPIIAEDLGEITPDVIELRDSFNLPGMKILQFGFSGPDNSFLPHHYVTNCVAYTGTHDNDTAVGWYQSAPAHEQDYYRRYIHSDVGDVAGHLVRELWASVAGWAVAPLQDLLSLGPEARMNFPGTLGGTNWAWRMDGGALSDSLSGRLRDLNYIYQR